MKKKIISLVLVLSMLLSLSVYLASCNKGAGQEAASETGTSAPTGNENTSESESESDVPTEDFDAITYPEGVAIKGAGLKWDVDAFASAEHGIDESKAVEKSAAEMLALLENRDVMAEGEVYKVTEPLVLTSNTKYYGNLAAIIAEGGIVIKDAENIVIKELIVKGNITVESSKSITFFKLDLKGGEIGVTVDDKSDAIAFKSSKIYATDTAVKTDAPTTFYQCYVSADKGIMGTADNSIVQDCKIEAKSLGVALSGGYITVKSCEISADASGFGVHIGEGASNALVALNIISGAQKSVKVNGGFNCVVLLNTAIRVIGEDNKNLYVVENNLGGVIELRNNQYLLCDSNVFPAGDGIEHITLDVNNTDFNGSNMHDVNARLEYGADEDLLPHTNKDLFIDMERQEIVTDLSLTKSYGVNNYLRAMSKENSIVILAPGAYTTSTYLRFDTAHSNTTVYGFGAYVEKTERGTHLWVYAATNINFKGLTLGYSFQSSGQIHVLDKLADNQLLVITNAGYIDDFGQSNLDYFANNACYMFKVGEIATWNNLGSAYSVVKKNDDGTMVIKLTGTDRNSPTSFGPRIYDMTEKGDMLTCRLSGDNASMVSIGNTSHNITMKDCVMYGYSSALGVVAGSKSTGISLERVHNTSRSPFVIDQATYEKYVQLEQTYDVDLEVHIDEEGRYRGGIPRIGSVDATHITGTKEGVDATSCLFENMCDDGSNQRGGSSRLAGYHINDDGTTTIYFKGTISQTYWNLNTNALKVSVGPTMVGSLPIAGDRIYSYASNGHVAFDTVALSNAVAVTSSPEFHVAHFDHLDNSTIKEGDVTNLNESFSYITGTDANPIINVPKCTDGLCDHCGKVLHIDSDKNGRCDFCNAMVHLDFDDNNKCDIGGCDYNIKEFDDEGTGICKDGKAIIRDRFYITRFNTETGRYNVTAKYSKSSVWYTITYNTYIYEVKVKTEDVDFDAFEGYDFTDNEYEMDHKILFDNLSANSVGFTFDNVLVRNSTARGILCKTLDATIKNCTFRSNASTGILLSVETTWGESTVPKNILITACLFDDTGRSFDREMNPTYSCIAIQGLGANSTSTVVSENTLPCKDIKIIGNKFINVNNKHAISISAAQNILIQNNVFEARDGAIDKNMGKSIYINGAMDVKVVGNTFPVAAGGDITKLITAVNYKNLNGADVEGKIAADKDPVPAS